MHFGDFQCYVNNDYGECDFFCRELIQQYDTDHKTLVLYCKWVKSNLI